MSPPYFCVWVLPAFPAFLCRQCSGSGRPERPPSLSLQLPLWIPSVILPFRHCSSHSALRIVHPGASECWPKFGAEELSGMAKVRVSRKEWQLHVMHHLWRNWTVNILFQSKKHKKTCKNQVTKLVQYSVRILTEMCNTISAVQMLQCSSTCKYLQMTA